MAEKIKVLILRKKQLILYLLFGGITTVCSLAACYLTLRLGVFIWHDEQGEPTAFLDILGSTAQWVVGVLVAFVTNKKWVFVDAERGFRVTMRQLGVFSGSRVATYFMEVVINLGVIALFDALNYRAPMIPVLGWRFELTARIWAKVISSIVVVIANYFISKLVVFRRKQAVAEGEREIHH
ncbi:MAG: GtrA family protein [Clostridia bacterium]|nr:GtrA family protein [Clostridia bacterium]